MIDQQLINENSKLLIDGLAQAKPVTQQLNLLGSVFTPALIEKLKKYFSDHAQSDLWVPETTTYHVPQGHLPRHKLTWDADTVIEEVHEICNNATDAVRALYPNNVKQFNGIIIWRDRPGFNIRWHTDNPVIDISMQIYISGSEKNPGTEFEVDDHTVVAPFVENSGYIVRHSGESRPRHRITHPVPDGEERYSLFAIWGDSF